MVFRIDGIERSISVADKSKPEMLSVAQEDVKTIEEERELEWNGEELSDGYYRFVLPEEKEFAIKAANLTSVRTAPVQAEKTSQKYDYTVRLPKGCKMIGDEVKLQKKVEGLGEVLVTIKQSGRKLKISRVLTIEKDIIMPKDYESFRALIQAWDSHREIYLKSK